MASTPQISAPAAGNGTTPQLLRIGDLARATGKTVRALHLYEELGLLRPATRTSGGFRLYEPVSVDRVRWIDSLHALGFSLQEMREVLRSWWNAGQGDTAMTDLRALFLRKLDETRDAIRRHQQLERELQEGLAYLEACESCAAPGPVQACAHCQQDHGVADPPSLVAGINSPPDSPRRGARPPLVRIDDAPPEGQEITTRTDSSAPGITKGAGPQ